MTDLVCALHGAYDGDGECPCCLSTGGQAVPESTLCLTVNDVRLNAGLPLLFDEADSGYIRAQWKEVFENAYKALDCNPDPTATRIATLEAENATLRAKLSAAEEALAGVRTAQKAAAASIEPVGPTELYRPVGPLERATGAGPSQPARAVLAALAGRVVR